MTILKTKKMELRSFHAHSMKGWEMNGLYETYSSPGVAMERLM